MSIEERLRESLRNQVDAPPAVRDLAHHSLRAAARIRRLQAGAGVAVVAMLVVVVPLQLRGSRDGTQDGVAATPSDSAATSSAPTSAPAEMPATTSPSLTADSVLPAPSTMLPLGALPRVQYLINDRLIRPFDEAARLVLGAYQQLLATANHTIGLRGGPNQSSEIVIVEKDGSIKVLISEPGAILGIAADDARLAYSLQTSIGDGIGIDFVLLDIATGQVVKRLQRSPIASVPVAMTGDTVLMADGLGPEHTVSTWNLATNKYDYLYAESGGDIALDAVRDVALLGEGDTSCAAVWDLAAANQRFSSCIAGIPSDVSDAFGLLAPDGKRYAGTRYVNDDPAQRWPVIGDAATGEIDDRLRVVFETAGLRVSAAPDPRVVWEDATHVIVLADSAYRSQVLVRCDVDAASCEEAFNSATLSSVQDARLRLVRPVH